MNQTDIIYLAMLVLAMPYGHVLKLCDEAVHRKVLCLIPGLLIGYLLVGVYGLCYSFAVVCGTFILVTLKPRYYTWWNFLFVFGFLLFFRKCTSLNLPEPPKHCNAIQLLVTLRMISLAFELDKQATNHDKRRNKLSSSIFDVFTYGYCYIGLMTGPFYTYQTFTDMTLNKHANKISTVLPAILNLKLLPIVGFIYLFFKEHYPLENLLTESSLHHDFGILYVLWCLFCQYTWMSFRFYVGWLMAESACMFAALGAYPVSFKATPGNGPTEFKHISKLPDVEFSFETIRNIDVIRCAVPTSIRDATKKWNMTVQWWLVQYVYKNAPFKSRNLKSLLLIVASAYWHGIHVGYYVTFITHMLYIIAETLFLKTMGRYYGKEIPNWLKLITWFSACRFLEYVVVGFAYLEWQPVIVIYKRVYFYYHIGIVVILVFTAAFQTFCVKIARHDDKFEKEKTS